MMKGKKSLGYGTLAVIVLIFVVLLILLPYTDRIVGILKRNGDVETCRLSVLAQSQVKAFGKSPIKLKCGRRQVEFFNNKVEINGKKESKYN